MSVQLKRTAVCLNRHWTVGTQMNNGSRTGLDHLNCCVYCFLTMYIFSPILLIKYDDLRVFCLKRHWTVRTQMNNGSRIGLDHPNCRVNCFLTMYTSSPILLTKYDLRCVFFLLKTCKYFYLWSLVFYLFLLVIQFNCGLNRIEMRWRSCPVRSPVWFMKHCTNHVSTLVLSNIFQNCAAPK